MNSSAVQPRRLTRSWLAARRGLAAMDAVGRTGIFLLGAIALVSIVVPPFAADPTASVGPAFEPPSTTYFFGTDDVGQDIFSRVLHGTRSSLFSALIVIASGVLIGGLVGLVAGTRGGAVDSLLMRLTDVFLSLPGPVLAIAVVAALGPSLQNTVIGIAVVWWPWYARIVRGEVRALASRPNIDAARLSGISQRRLMLRHLLPGAIPPVIVTASLDIQILVLTLAGLSFIGLGAPPPAPELGAMAARGTDYLFSSPWIAMIPGAAVFFIAVAANLAGDGIRDAFGKEREE